MELLNLYYCLGGRNLFRENLRLSQLFSDQFAAHIVWVPYGLNTNIDPGIVHSMHNLKPDRSLSSFSEYDTGTSSIAIAKIRM